MAHLARLQTLTDELIEVVADVSQSQDAGRYSVIRESTLRGLRHHNYLRTNHFDVASRLDGLEERFRVNHRETLADALRERRRALAQFSPSWQPEILHLLLELSDQPTRNTQLSDLELLREPEPEPEPPLRWEDIAREDGWDEDSSIWQSVDYADSSDDGGTVEKLSETDSETDSSEFDVAANLLRAARSLVVDVKDEPGLQAAKEAQGWRSERSADGPRAKVMVDEPQVLREALFMLQGVKTTLFAPDCSIDPAFQADNTSWEAFRAVTSTYSEAGRSLRTLRSFAEQHSTLPLLQVFQDSISKRLEDFGRQVTKVETRLVRPRGDVVVSLIPAYEELRPHLDPMLSLAEIVSRLGKPSSSGAFRYLELMFDEITMAQLTGRSAAYEFLARIFLDCFQVYLRPIRLWMEEGRLVPRDKIFFVSQVSTELPPEKLWESQYTLRRTPAGVLHAPAFLAPTTEKIFTAGKSIVVLRQLRKYDGPGASQGNREPGLGFEDICSKDLQMAPFPELFAAAFERWIQSKHLATSKTLNSVLFDSCGLVSALKALRLVYFQTDGSLAGAFCAELYGRLDKLDRKWSDGQYLTIFAQDLFAGRLDARRLSVVVSRETSKTPAADARGNVRKGIPGISPRYRLAWPVRLVVTDATLEHYRAVFTFLLQFKRASACANQSFKTDAASRGSDLRQYYALRSSLLWFFSILQTYLVTLVLSPRSSKLELDLQQQGSVDGLIAAHAAFAKQVVDECCLGSRLAPIHDCILDVFDLAVALRDAQMRKEAELAREMQEISRLSLPVSPRRRDGPADYSDSEDGAAVEVDAKPYAATLKEIGADLQRHLRFITSGLRGVARATSDPAAAKWDLLAEMLETGVKTER